MAHLPIYIYGRVIYGRVIYGRVIYGRVGLPSGSLV
jgi:hypothetical protein